jgi:porin
LTRAPRAPLAWIAALTASACLATGARAESPPQRTQLTGDWGGLRGWLAERGVVPWAQYVTAFFANVHGGSETGIRYVGFASWGVDLDLAKLAHWPGASFHLSWHSYHGGLPSNDLVGQFPTDDVSGLESAVSVRFYDIYLRQELWDGALELKAGQIAADEDFFVSRYAGTLVNATFALFGSGRSGQILPFFPLAGPGAYAQVRPSEEWTLRAGAYTADPGDDESGNFGFGWHLDEGASFLGEIATSRSPAGLPGTYTLGVAGTTAELASFRSGERVHGSWGIYAMLDQALLLDGHGEPRLGVFLRGRTAGESDRAVVRAYGNAGLGLRAPLPGRERDVFSIGASYTRFAHDYLRSVRAGGQRVSSHEAVLELTYRAQLCGWLALQPDFQLVLDPHTSRRDAVVLGMQATLTF